MDDGLLSTSCLCSGNSLFRRLQAANCGCRREGDQDHKTFFVMPTLDPPIRTREHKKQEKTKTAGAWCQNQIVLSDDVKNARHKHPAKVKDTRKTRQELSVNEKVQLISAGFRNCVAHELLSPIFNNPIARTLGHSDNIVLLS